MEEILKEHIIRDIDFSGQELADVDFSGKELAGVNFENCTLVGCNFDGCRLERCSFKHAHIMDLRFRKAKIEWSDFRYVEINKATFEQASLDFCDFYRADIDGVVIMRKARISNCSLYYTRFGSAVLLHKDNFVGGKILQQDKKAYRKFLTEWHIYGCGERTNDMNKKSDWSSDEAIRSRYVDAEEIYKTLSGFWQQIGLLQDSNWAYVKGRKMETHRMIHEFPGAKWYDKLRLLVKIPINALMDLCFGFGESLSRMIITYIVIIFLFAFFLFSEVDMLTYLQGLKLSLLNMVGSGSEELSNVSPLVDMLNVVQTTLGTILTGIFGFILGNKIRNQ